MKHSSAIYVKTFIIFFLLFKDRKSFFFLYLSLIYEEVLHHMYLTCEYFCLSYVGGLGHIRLSFKSTILSLFVHAGCLFCCLGTPDKCWVLLLKYDSCNIGFGTVTRSIKLTITLKLFILLLSECIPINIVLCIWCIWYAGQWWTEQYSIFWGVS